MERTTHVLPLDGAPVVGQTERRRPEFFSYVFFAGLFATTFLV